MTENLNPILSNSETVHLYSSATVPKTYYILTLKTYT